MSVNYLRHDVARNANGPWNAIRSNDSRPWHATSPRYADNRRYATHFFDSSHPGHAESPGNATYSCPARLTGPADAGIASRATIKCWLVILPLMPP